MTTNTIVRRTLLATVPVLWMGVAFLHPSADPETPAASLDGHVGTWIFVHVAQLFLAAGLGALLWTLIRDRTGRAATLVRVTMPIYLVMFAAFDSVVGLATGLILRHDLGDGAAVESLISDGIAGNLSLVSQIAQGALLTVIVSTALVLRRAGGSRWVWWPMLGGVLMVMHFGATAAVGLAAIAFAAVQADREGLIAGSARSIALPVTRVNPPHPSNRTAA
jgi:hypothetical protein